MLRRAIRAVLPAGLPRLAGGNDLGPATPTAIWSAIDAQDALAAGVLADLKAQAAAKSAIAAAILSALKGDVIDHALRNAIISKERFPSWNAMAMIAKNGVRPRRRLQQKPHGHGVINDQQLVGENGKPKPSPIAPTTNRALQQSRTGRVSVNSDMVVRSVLGLCSAVGECVTHLNMADGIGFSTAVEEKNTLALRGPGELFTRGDAEKLLAELNALGRR